MVENGRIAIGSACAKGKWLRSPGSNIHGYQRLRRRPAVRSERGCHSAGFPRRHRASRSGFAAARRADPDDGRARDGLAQNVGRGDKPRTEEQRRKHSELGFGQVAVADDVGQDAVAVADPKPLDMLPDVPFEPTHRRSCRPDNRARMRRRCQAHRNGRGDFQKIGRLVARYPIISAIIAMGICEAYSANRSQFVLLLQTVEQTVGQVVNSCEV